MKTKKSETNNNNVILTPENTFVTKKQITARDTNDIYNCCRRKIKLWYRWRPLTKRICQTAMP